MNALRPPERGLAPSQTAPRPADKTTLGRRPKVMAIGAITALGIPMLQVLVAFLWSLGAINPDPNGPGIQTLQNGSLLELFLGPIGIALVGIGARLSNLSSWFGLCVASLPVLAVLWFIAAAWLGGLAGEPF